MKKAFRTLWRHITNSRFNIIKLVVILFLPLLYGFSYIASFWDPMSYSENLKIGIVLKDTNPISKSIAKETTNLHEVLGHKINIDLREGSNPKVEDLYSYVEIPENYIANLSHYLATGKDEDKPSLIIHGSYAKNYIVAQGTSLLAAISDKLSVTLTLNAMKILIATSTDKNSTLQNIKHLVSPNGPNPQPLLYTILDQIQQGLVKGEDFNVLFDTSIKSLDALLNSKHLVSFKEDIYGKDKGTYGYGLSPFFISIAVWIGALMQSFVIRGRREEENITSFQNWFTKMVFGQIIGFIQTTILITMLIPIGLKLGTHQWELYFFAYFMSFIFVFIGQSILFLFKREDIGKFIMLVLLIIQLVASGGIFPTELQPTGYSAISYILPFKYSILGLRGVIYSLDGLVVLKNVGILLAFAVVFVGISLPIQEILYRKHIKKKRA